MNIDTLLPIPNVSTWSGVHQTCAGDIGFHEGRESTILTDIDDLSTSQVQVCSASGTYSGVHHGLRVKLMMQEIRITANSLRGNDRAETHPNPDVHHGGFRPEITKT